MNDTAPGRSGPDIREIGGADALDSLRPAWKQLVDRCGDDSPYLTPEFMMPWIRFVRARYACRVLTAWEGDKLIGLAPLFERSVGRMGLSFTTMTFPLMGFSPPFDIIVAERRDAVMAGFVDHWMANGRWDLIELLNVASESQTGEALRAAAARAGVRLQSEESLRTTYVPVESTWERFLASKTKKMRHNLRRAQSRCESLGGYRFARYPGGDLSLEQAIGMAFRVIDNSWKRSDTGGPDWNGFLRDLYLELAAGGMLCLRFLLIAEQPVAYHLEIDYRRNLHGFHNAYDLAYQAENPGQLLLSDGLRDVHERGYGRFDFLGTKDYLNRWTESTRSFRRLWLVRDSIVSAAKSRLYFWERNRRAEKAMRRTEATKNDRKDSNRRQSEREADGRD